MSVNVFGNDFAMDVKDDFNNLIGVGKTIPEIEDYILAYKPDDGGDDACAFWSALALIEWEYGVLSEGVKRKAIEIMRTNDDAHLFANPKDKSLRKKALDDLIVKLDTLNNKPRKPKKPFVFHSRWKQGDIFALPIKDHYVYFHVSGIRKFEHRIKELQEDEVFVKVFSCVSEELFDFASLIEKAAGSNDRYVLLSSDKWNGKVDTKWIWCRGTREKKKLDESAILIGNLPTEEKTTRSVYADFQYEKLEETISRLFGFE